ncbi:MAG: hypothetical protein WC919_05650 [Candidatus Paceibacterota bacterium]|jgi:hypothetical protein
MTKKFVPPQVKAKSDSAWKLNDGAAPGAIVQADVEKAYRRGFAQGVLTAQYFLERGIDPEDMARWAAVIEKWRECGSRWIKGQPVLAQWPPEPKINKKGKK